MYLINWALCIYTNQWLANSLKISKYLNLASYIHDIIDILVSKQWVNIYLVLEIIFIQLVIKQWFAWLFYSPETQATTLCRTQQMPNSFIHQTQDFGTAYLVTSHQHNHTSIIHSTPNLDNFYYKLNSSNQVHIRNWSLRFDLYRTGTLL